jgi:HTH-type transcriptional regulator, cell division transcriptional repressor
MKSSLAERIRHSRQAKGLSASDLARALGVTPASVWNWEKNGARPRSAMAAAMADTLGISKDFLLTGNGKGPGNGGTVEKITEKARKEISRTTGVPADRIRIRVEFLSE